MRLFLAFAVTLSFLAGQACGQGVRMFHSLETGEHDGLMSSMVMQCSADMYEDIAGTSADCGPGKCMENAKDEPDDVATVSVRTEVSCLPAALHVTGLAPTRIALLHQARTEPRLMRPVLEVRRE